MKVTRTFGGARLAYPWCAFIAVLAVVYRSRAVVSEYDAVFNCYVNAFGEWQCGLSESRQRGETKSIPLRQ